MQDKGNKKITIAVMTGSVQSDYALEMMRGFYTSSRDNGIHMITLMGPQSPTSCADIVNSGTSTNYTDQFNSVYQYVHFLKPDAIIVTYGSVSGFITEQSKQSFLDMFSDIPCLMIEDESFSEKIPSLTADNYSGMKACVNHLVADHGYRKIAFLSGPKGNYDAEERLRAYRDVMREHNLPVTDEMIAYGDFSDLVEEQIVCLLNQNLGLEAIACADDVMAKACYRVCNMRSLIVGRDIAITGFDDTSSAGIMNPPLTSVSQNTFELSYAAMNRAIAMCRGEKIVSEKVPAVLRKRVSCGCPPLGIVGARYVPLDEMKDFIDEALRELSSSLFATVPYEPDRQCLSDMLSEYFIYIYDTIFRGNGQEFRIEQLMDILRRIISFPYFSNEQLVEKTIQFLSILLANAPSESAQKQLSAIISTTQQTVHAYNIQKLEREIYISTRKAWFVPMLTKKLVSEEYMHNPENIFVDIMTEMKKMSFKAAYFLLFEKPILYESKKALSLPENADLVAYFDKDEMKFLGRRKQRFSCKEGFCSFIADRDLMSLNAVVLFSDNRQYGMLICDVEYEDIAFLQICGVQLGTLLHFLELNQMEQLAQKELQNSLQVIREQNRILSFLSEYDELTKLLNRRGFIERVLSLYEQSDGQQSYLIFGDLDHLKEINDVFGHVEGDFALNSIAQRFNAILPENAITGRIGGDEFVSFVLTDEAGFAEKIEKEFADAGKAFNEESDKPYYIDCSIGIYRFLCNPRLDFNDMLKKSDDLLYRAKAKRRKSICKEKN